MLLKNVLPPIKTFIADNTADSTERNVLKW